MIPFLLVLACVAPSGCPEPIRRDVEMETPGACDFVAREVATAMTLVSGLRWEGWCDPVDPPGDRPVKRRFGT